MTINKAPVPLAAPLAGVLSRYRGSLQRKEKRPPGRPLKRSTQYLLALLVAHRQVASWFVAEHGCLPRSDIELYTAYFGRLFESGGERSGKAQGKSFNGALKTLRNELAEARRFERTNPGNDPISGTATRVE